MFFDFAGHVSFRLGLFGSVDAFYQAGGRLFYADLITFITRDGVGGYPECFRELSLRPVKLLPDGAKFFSLHRLYRPYNSVARVVNGQD